MSTTGLGKLQAAFAQHRTPILAGGAAATAALGLYVHHKNAANGTPTPTAAATPAAGGATIAGVADPGSVDTTGSDVYNALQPQMAQEQSLLAQLLATLQAGIPKPTSPVRGGPVHTTKTPKHKSPVDGSPPARPGPIKPKPPVRAHPPKGPSHKTPTPRRYYTVVKGDNLTEIGRRFHTTWQKIYAANRSTIGRNPNLIRPGQHLVIP